MVVITVEREEILFSTVCRDAIDSRFLPSSAHCCWNCHCFSADQSETPQKEIFTSSSGSKVHRFTILIHTIFLLLMPLNSI